VEGDWFWWGVFDIFAFGYREEGADLADAVDGLDECVAGAEWPCEEDAVERGGRGFGYGFEGLWAMRGRAVLGCAVG
jgi:hypothetical protein